MTPAEWPLRLTGRFVAGADAVAIAGQREAR
jgi:hypothetical protein